MVFGCVHHHRINTVVRIRHTCRRTGQPARDAANLGNLAADGNADAATGTAAATKRNAIDSPDANRRVSDCTGMYIAAGGDAMKQAQVLRRIDRLADSHLMACQFYKFAKTNGAHDLAANLLEFCETVDHKMRAIAGTDLLMRVMERKG